MPKSAVKKPEPQTMAELVEALGDQLIPFAQGDVVDVVVTAISRDSIIVDVGGIAAGIIPEKELSASLAKPSVGEALRAYIISAENDKGYVILSLRRAEKEKLWSMLESRNTNNEIVNVKVIQANRGGLVAQYNEMQGFIPVSQLSFRHYPRVGGDRFKIQQKLSELVGQTLPVKIISYDKLASKIVFSEKAAGDVDMAERAKQFKIGDRVTGKITGVVDFGLFVDLGEIEGLIHISQVAWQRISDLKEHFQVGQEIEAEVLNIDGDRVSLSIKKLLPDPWQVGVKDLEVGATITGRVTKVTPYGAFVRISDSLEGLYKPVVLVEGQPPELGVEEDQPYQFEVLSIEPELRKISLKLVGGG
ncbi:MAG: S1 RNA-binding domain-containing protein [Patescibacteria group bacterium]